MNQEDYARDYARTSTTELERLREENRNLKNAVLELHLKNAGAAELRQEFKTACELWGKFYQDVKGTKTMKMPSQEEEMLAGIWKRLYDAVVRHEAGTHILAELQQARDNSACFYDLWVKAIKERDALKGAVP